MPDDTSSKEFEEAYARALAKLPQIRRLKVAPQTIYKGLILASLEKSLIGAQQRARKKALPCTITKEWLRNRLEAIGFRCELTSIQFYSDAFSGSAGKRAVRPSLDRIDCSRGYEPDNVRIVCLAVNVMLSNWGEDLVRSIARRMTIRQTGHIAAEVNKKSPRVSLQKYSHPLPKKISKRNNGLIVEIG